MDHFADSIPVTSVYGGSYGYGSQTKPTCAFPYDLMHRKPLAKMAGITGDPLGPGIATQRFRAADPTRVGVVTVFEKPGR